MFKHQILIHPNKITFLTGTAIFVSLGAPGISR